MNNKKGFTLVELMVVVAIVAILAAVALPMYSTFKQKSKVSNAIKGLTGATSALQAWFDDNATFVCSNSWAVAADGGSLTCGTTRVGSGLPEIEDMAWGTTPTATSTAFTIAFTWSRGCPSNVCDGSWTLTCDSNNDKCDVTRTIGTNNELGLNK